MAHFTKFEILPADLLAAVHDFGSDTFKVALTDYIPLATFRGLSDIEEVPEEGGYVSGGVPVVISRIEKAGFAGVRIFLANTAISAVGGRIGPFRCAVLYNASRQDWPLVGWYDQGVSRSLPDGGGVTLVFDQIDGALGLSTG